MCVRVPEMLLPCVVVLLTPAAARPTVLLASGAVEGVVEESMRVFRGIPYAEPPVGALRWRAPVPKASWKPSVLDASIDGSGCPQICNMPKLACPVKQSEDCLFLNVFAPLKPPTKLLPVSLFIHGGDVRTKATGAHRHSILSPLRARAHALTPPPPTHTLSSSKGTAAACSTPGRASSRAEQSLSR
jgi:para-nitrobenzyl esterase